MSSGNLAHLHDYSSQSSQAAANAPPRLLIIDDVEDNRTALARRFERCGFNITEADCGRAALKLVDEQEFDLVLLDMMTPDIESTEVLRIIRTKHNSASLPVIMVTGRVMSEEIVQALQCGADDYIAKPVDFAVALARVNTQVARRKAERDMLKAAEALLKSKEILEERVRERTRDLVRINEQLKDEIVQRERSETETKYLAHHDALTGLANRILFRKSIEAVVDASHERVAGLAVLFIDLDGFKSVNDALGHSIGDALLCIIAERLKALMPPHGMIARLGGDEFAVMLSNAPSVEDAIRLARDIVQKVSEVVSIDGNEITVGASIGIALRDKADLDIDELLRNADLAMYRAKSDGRGTWRVYNASMYEAAQARRQLELDMRRALSVGDFRIYFQPIVNLKEMRVTSFEALLRWDHATRGIMAPDDFIPVAEETGLIVPLGEWMIREACRHAMTWPEDINVAVNLSRIEFSRGNIVASIMNGLAATGLNPNRLEIEITESTLLERTESTIETLSQLRALGLCISMDDFGTGYSSLNYLRDFRFDKIKIDRSFVKDIPGDEESRAIVQAITLLSAQFGVKTTAEGIETIEQLRYVSGEGCTEVQGRLFSMPVPASEIPGLLAQLSASDTME
jgi:diguanylate cyclase (GGDEF)-like protein